MALKFNAKAVLMKKVDGQWSEQRVRITCIEDILAFFTPFEKETSQVNLSMALKIYHNINSITTGIDAKVTDMEGNREYMASPLLLVECNAEYPIDISESGLKNIKEAIDFG
jgi:hypothetical protein